MFIKQRLQEKIKVWHQRVDLKVFLKSKKRFLFVLSFFLVFFLLTLTFVARFRSLPLIAPLISRLTPEGPKKQIETSSSIEDETAADTPKPMGTSVPLTPSPRPTATYSPTAIPTMRITNPPIINISYPIEMQSIEMRSDQTLCLVDTPAGGNTSGLKRRHNLNETDWTAYAGISTLCFEPQEGLNRIQFQYKNSYGDESTVYTRQFNFHRLQNINITLSGNIYRDENCNGTHDSGENNINISASVYIWKPGYIQQANIQSNSNGTFSYSTNIVENEALTLFPSVVSPTGYKANPHYKTPSFTFDKNNRSASVDYPQVPNESVGQCY